MKAPVHSGAFFVQESLLGVGRVRLCQTCPTGLKIFLQKNFERIKNDITFAVY